MEPDNVLIARALVAYHAPNPLTSVLLSKIMCLPIEDAFQLLEEAERPEIDPHHPSLFSNEEVISHLRGTYCPAQA